MHWFVLLAWGRFSSSLVLQESLYIGLLGLLLAASLGLPLPEDIPLLLTGCLCRLGYGYVGYAVPVGLVGVLTGDLILYSFGYRFGVDVLKRRPFRYLVTRTHIAQMKRQFRKRGNKIIFFGRFFAGFRSLMCLTAGLCRVPPWKFILIDVSGALITVPMLIGLGWWFSHNVEKIAEGVVAIEHVLGGAVAAAVVGWVIYIHLAKRKPKPIARMLGENSGQSEGSSQAVAHEPAAAGLLAEESAEEDGLIG